MLLLWRNRLSSGKAMQLLMDVAALGLELVHRKGDHVAIYCWTRITVAATGLRPAINNGRVRIFFLP
jgi:hypothetical protein